MLSDRQGEMLNSIVLEYISSAQPVSSQVIEDHFSFGISPATIRNEMKLLESEGYLLQPHISAGRIPTDQGYRFFVDTVYTDQDYVQEPSISEIILRELAQSTHSLVLWRSANRLQKEGWEFLLDEPEFDDRQYVKSFTVFLSDVEKNFTATHSQNIQVFIGKENPYSNVHDFSIIISGDISLAGPKRMAYDKNIQSIKSIWKKKKLKN
jgi:transcriptional regulator of heat shock response